MRKKKSKWSERNTRTVIPNVAHILPPDLPPNLIQIFLLRFQLEEVEYKLSRLDDESGNVYDSDLFGSDNTSNIVKARDSLIKERQQILASIEKVFPIFKPPISFKMFSKQAVRRITLTSDDVIRKIMGLKGSLLNDLERDYKVKISFETPNDEERKPAMVIIGNRKDDVENCHRRVKSMLETWGEPVNDEEVRMVLSFDPEEDIPPWNQVKANTSGEEVETAVNELMRELYEQKTNDDAPEAEEIRQIFQNFEIDLTYKDISAVLREPTPLGLPCE